MISRLSGLKMAVFDMAGTVINEKGLVYKTLYETLRDAQIQVKESDINEWHGANKYEVLDHFVKQHFIQDNIDPGYYSLRKVQIYKQFNSNLKEYYFSDNNISLIHPEVPALFADLRNKGIKITLNTGYNSDIQEAIIHNLRLKDIIDDYISSDLVFKGRPSPYMILKLMEDNNIDNPNMVMKVGDTPNDIIEGHNAKCKEVIGVLSGISGIATLLPHNPTKIIYNIMELTEQGERDEFT